MHSNPSTTARNPDGSQRARSALGAWPTYGLVENLLPTIAQWRDAGKRVALATLVHTKGSSPRPLGSEMAVNEDGDIIGFVSGGCVERAVADEGVAAIRQGEPRMLDYGEGSPVVDIQLPCNGRIGAFVRPLTDLDGYVRSRQAAFEERRTIDHITDLDDGRSAFNAIPSGAERVFRKQFLPEPRLVVAGRDPVTLALCEAAPHFGFETVLLCPHGPKQSPESIPFNQYDTRTLSRALEDLRLDGLTAVYTLLHETDEDHQVLRRALASEAFSIGALGGRRRRREREALLREEGFDDSDLERLSTPAGIDIGARQPQEIALSILAEATANRPRPVAEVLASQTETVSWARQPINP